MGDLLGGLPINWACGAHALFFLFLSRGSSFLQLQGAISFFFSREITSICFSFSCFRLHHQLNPSASSSPPRSGRSSSSSSSCKVRPNRSRSEAATGARRTSINSGEIKVISGVELQAWSLNTPNLQVTPLNSC